MGAICIGESDDDGVVAESVEVDVDTVDGGAGRNGAIGVAISMSIPRQAVPYLFTHVKIDHVDNDRVSSLAKPLPAKKSLRKSKRSNSRTGNLSIGQSTVDGVPRKNDA